VDQFVCIQNISPRARKRTKGHRDAGRHCGRGREMGDGKVGAGVRNEVIDTVLVHVPPMSRAARRTSIDTIYTTTSTRDSSINMNPIHEATAAIESRDSGDKLVYQEYAKYFDVDRSTLSRRHKGCQGT
jgi:hypothetical protein